MNEPKFKVGDQVEYTGLTGTKGDRFIGSVDYVYSTIDANGNTRGTSFQDEDLRLAPLKPLKVGDLVKNKSGFDFDGIVVEVVPAQTFSNEKYFYQVYRTNSKDIALYYCRDLELK
jgi:hypothetical protein